MIRRHRWLACLCGVCFLLISCERRPLVSRDQQLSVQVVMEVEDILNVSSGIYNSRVPVPRIHPQVVQALFYEVHTHRLVAEGFLSHQEEDEDRLQLVSGEVSLCPGVYDLLCYNFDTSSTQVRNEENWNEIEAFTNELGMDRYQSLPSYMQNERICYEPDHLLVAREQVVRIEEKCNQQVIRTKAYPIMDTYYIQVPLKGGSAVSKVVAVMTGLSPSNKLARDERYRLESSGVIFEMFKDEEPDVSGEGRKSICAVFNTFGKIPEAESVLKLVIYTVDGRVVQKVMDMDEVFQTEDAIKRHWLLVDEEIVLPDPLFPPDGEGGFDPGLDDWEEDQGEIEIN